MRSLQEIITRVLRIQNEQHTFCYCPICDYELVGSDSFVSDNRRGVTYKCLQCGCKSRWNFDMAPAPILIAHQRFETKLTPYKYWSGKIVQTPTPREEGIS